MKKTILFTTIALLFSLMGGCEKDDKKTINKALLGTWKCIGFGNTETGKIRPIEPQNCDRCYIITFKQNGTLLGISSLVNIKMNYSIINDKILFDEEYAMTDIGEMGDGNQFRYLIAKNKNRFLIKKKQLSIFYSKNEYLLFNRKNKEE